MEKDRSIKEDSEKLYNRVMAAIRAGVPLETQPNSMTTIKSGVKVVWRPNNYRRQIRVKTLTNSTIERLNSAIYSGTLRGHRVKHTGLFFFSLKQGFTLQLGRTSLTAMYKQPVHPGGHKEAFLIERETLQEAGEVVAVRAGEIRDRLDGALEDFIGAYGIGVFGERPKWSRFEDMIKGEDFIDRLPAGLIVHDTIFKKVYDKGLEFKGSGESCPEAGVYVKNYLKNRALEDFAPGFLGELAKVRASQEQLLAGFVPAIERLSRNMEAHVSVMQGIDRGFRRFNRLLSRFEQRTLKDWLR